MPTNEANATTITIRCIRCKSTVEAYPVEGGVMLPAHFLCWGVLTRCYASRTVLLFPLPAGSYPGEGVDEGETDTFTRRAEAGFV